MERHGGSTSNDASTAVNSTDATRHRYIEEAEEDDDYQEFDDLEAELMGDGIYGSGGGGRHLADYSQKINLSSRVQNDITRSELKGDRQSSYYGKDDRATSEQVMDPRTRLILFKLLNSGFLGEIDGNYINHCVYITSIFLK